MIKPAELIDITGAAGLTLAARRLYNILLAHAFGKEMGIEGYEWTIPLADLRGTHKGNERIEDSIIALMKTIVMVRLHDGRTRRVALLGGNDMGDPDRRHGALTYSFDKRLVPLLKESTVFGKLELAVLRAFSTKYALALYEAIARRVRLEHIFSEEFSLEDFRELLGVPPGKLTTYGNLNQYAIKPAITEINALAAFNVKVLPRKQGRRVVGVLVGWWHKDLDELKQAYAETQRPHVGRKARITNTVESVVDAPELPLN
ncbi:replication initiation protein [Microbaculum sp. FT89]|uniref:replication initiation protein n=1 Tax=Microbaculum sp. FT89 TaxID=3447298 RepID=UPI003F535116